MQLNPHAQNDNDDDEIIELTEIIEKGASVAAPSSSAEKDIFGPAMDDLSGGSVPDLPDDMDVDLDALLAQMDSDGGFSAAEEAERLKNEEAERRRAEEAASADGGDDAIDAMLSAEFGSGETDVTPEDFMAAPATGGDDAFGGDLPDMADIDALLADMDMPEQPQMEAGFDEPAAASMDEAQSADEMDALLESILDDKPAPAATSAPSKAIDEESAGHGLDALFDSVMQGEPAPVAVVAPVEPVASGAAKAPQKPEPVDVSTFDFGQESQANPAPVAAASDDLDALFQDVLGEAPLSAVDVAKAVVDSAQKQAPEAPAPAATMEDDAALLDMLFGEDGISAPVSDPASVLATEQGDEVEMQSTPREDVPQPERVDSVLDMLDEFLPGEPLEVDSAPSSVENSVDDFMDDVFAPAPEGISGATSEAKADFDMDDIFGSDSDSEISANPASSEEESFVHAPLAPTQDELAMASAAAAAASAAAVAMSPEDSQQVQKLEERVSHLEVQVGQYAENTQDAQNAMVKDTKAHMQNLQESVQAYEQRMQVVEEQLQGQNQSMAETQTHEDYAHIVAQVQVEFEALRTEVQAQAERLMKAEELSQTVARDANARDMAAREALSSYIDKLEFVAKEAVNREVTAHESMQQSMAKLEQTMQAQEELSKAYAKRITDLEEQLQAFEKSVEQNIERMAVAAAAKILREEIAALVSES